MTDCLCGLELLRAVPAPSALTVCNLNPAANSTILPVATLHAALPGSPHKLVGGSLKDELIVWLLTFSDAQVPCSQREAGARHCRLAAPTWF